MSHQTTSSAVVRDEGRRGNKESRTRPLAGQTGRPPQCHPHDCAERYSSPETVATCCGTYTEQPSTGDIEAELEKLTMNAWRAPEMVGATHLANERAQLSRDLRSANTVARPPAPIHSKSGAVPPNDRLRPHNRNRAQNGGKPAIEPNKQKSIGIVQVRPFRRPSSEYIDLLPQHQDFPFQLCSRLEKRS